jgi:prepilin-type N-terminal cleavage/methylation domain-containing protein
VSQTGRPRRGFTLTEILMAVGILGIGLTMVASVFPVAVDQSRRSREITMAALCARSVAATIRAKRDLIVYSAGGMGGIRYSTLDMTQPTTRPSKTIDLGITSMYRVYNPDAFLYEQDRSYQSNDKATDKTATMLAGNYYPVVLATPVVSSGAIPGMGPWRLTIIIYKSNGTWPDCINGDTTPTNTVAIANYMKSWYNPNITYHAQPGSYIVDWRGPTGTIENIRGEAYMIDNLTINTTGTAINWGASSVWLAATPTTATGVLATAGGTAAVTGTVVPSGTAGNAPIPTWVGMPQAIAAFHTIIGD